VKVKQDYPVVHEECSARRVGRMVCIFFARDYAVFLTM